MRISSANKRGQWRSLLNAGSTESDSTYDGRTLLWPTVLNKVNKNEQWLILCDRQIAELCYHLAIINSVIRRSYKVTGVTACYQIPPRNKNHERQEWLKSYLKVPLIPQLATWSVSYWLIFAVWKRKKQVLYQQIKINKTVWIALGKNKKAYLHNQNTNPFKEVYSSSL